MFLSSEQGMMPYKMSFSLEDKRECLPVIDQILLLANLARKEGLLALEKAAEEADTAFLKIGLTMILDGCEPLIVKEILCNYIRFSDYEGADLLKRMLLKDGLLAVQRGLNPHLIIEILLSQLGEAFYDEARAYFNDSCSADVTQRFFEDMDSDTYPEGANLLEETLLPLDNRSIQVILREINTHELKFAIKGSSKRMQKRLCDNVSRTMAIRLINECNAITGDVKDEIIAAQNKMLRLYHKHKEG